MSLLDKVKASQRFTSRTEQATHHRCPRDGFLRFHFDGRGLNKKKIGFEIVTGVYVHEIIGALLLGEDIETIIPKVLGKYDAEMNEENLYTWGVPFEEAAKEQKLLIEGLGRAWYFKRLGYFKENFDIVEVEKDHQVPLVETKEQWVTQEFRLDALLKDKKTGLYFVLSNKTTGNMDHRKQNDARTDLQGLSEVWGIETALGIKIHGVIMEYILTGKKEIEEDYLGKHLIYWSPVVRGWFNPMQDESHQFAWRYSWEDDTGKGHRLPKGYNRITAGEIEGGSKAWVQSLENGEFFPSSGAYNDPLGESFISIEYYREEDDVKDWLEQIQWHERRVQEGLEEIAKHEIGSKEYNRLLNQYFPQYRHSCNYPVRCGSYELCWGTARLDPMMYGFEYRKPHHEGEKERVKE